MDKQTQKNLLDIVKRNYKEIADDFDTTRKKYLWPELIKLTEPVKDGDRILDLGCGNGRLIEAFKNKKISYLGVDNSEALIELAKKNYIREIPRIKSGAKGVPSTAPRNNKWAVADILELDKLPEKDFDYIFCIAVLHHLPGDDLKVKALEQMKNKIKNNGKIIITVWNLWSQVKFRKLIFKSFLLKLCGKNKLDFGDILFDWKNNKGEKISQRYYHAFTKNELKKLATHAGFKIEKLYKNRFNYYLVLEK